MSVRIHGRHFLDAQGRVITLRGVNVSSNSKVPSSDPAEDIPFPEKTSYINRPFPIDEAPVHWQRLKRWGLTYLRVTVTWEAVEHAGPGIYDEEYLEYLRQLMMSMSEHGIQGYIALHQDVWSRHTGGSGAPAWTLRAAGFSADPRDLEETGAAYLGGVAHRGKVVDGERGLWPTGYTKLACATMNTLFWAGETFAPLCLVNVRTGLPVDVSPLDERDQSENIQTFLQGRFMAMYARLIDTLTDIPGVLGFELLNEPHPGYIALPTLHAWDYTTDLHLGPAPSPIQSFAAGAGHPTRVPVYTRSWPIPTRKTGTTALPRRPGARAWADGVQCPWAREGVWGWDTDAQRPVVLKEGYFTRSASGVPVDFYGDFYWPFVRRWQGLVERRARGKMVHVEAVPNEFCPVWPEEVKPRTLVYSPHWYDLNVLFNKTYGFMSVNVQGLARGMFITRALYFGQAAAKRNYTLQIGNIVRNSYKRLGEVPVVIGETGVPMDMNRREAFKSGDFTWQERMMDTLMTAIERNMVSVNLWNYNPRNDDVLGDDWNFENFSWFSEQGLDEGTRRDAQGAELDKGSRLIKAVVRPYALRTAGIPLSTEYSLRHGTFRFRFANPTSNPVNRTDVRSPPLHGHPAITTDETEIFLPPWFADASRAGKLVISCSDGTVRVDEDAQRVFWRHEETREGYVHEMRVRDMTVKVDEGGVWMWVLALVCILLGIIGRGIVV